MENKDTLVLEISGKKGIVGEYQRALYEASLLGIDRVLYCYVWDNNEKRGEEIFDKLIKTSEILNIIPVSTSIGCDEEMFSGPMVCKTDEDYNINVSLSQFTTFENYKKARENILENRENVGKVLAKHINDMI